MPIRFGDAPDRLQLAVGEARLIVDRDRLDGSRGAISFAHRGRALLEVDGEHGAIWRVYRIVENDVAVESSSSSAGQQLRHRPWRNGSTGFRQE